MSNGKIAIVVDSCTDVPEADIERFGMYVVPLQINYEKESFLDKVTISAEEVYSRLEEEVPRTSTPTPAVVGRFSIAWWLTASIKRSSSPFQAGCPQPMIF